MKKWRDIFKGLPLAAWLLLLLLVLAVTRPLWVGESVWPVAPVKFEADKVILKDRLLPPGALSADSMYTGARHWLGTDHLGRDVAAGLFSGLQIAFKVGLGAVLFSIIAGALAGFFAGWYGDHKLVWTRRGCWLRLAVFAGCMLPAGQVILLWRVGSISAAWIWSVLLLLVVICLLSAELIGRYESRQPMDRHSVHVPLDMLISRLMEWMEAIPVLILILALSALWYPHTEWTLVLILGLVRWPVIARFMRAEVLRIRANPFVVRAERSGLKTWQIWLWEILPNVWGSLPVFLAYGVAAVILLESTLSFLGIGLPVETVSWGVQLDEARRHPDAWWLLVFPAGMLLLILLSLNSMAEALQRKLGGKGRRLRF